MAFKCTNCGECCGPVPVTGAELSAIMDALRQMPKDIRDSLAAQERGELTCMFRDVKAQRCSIYPVRPLICRMYGHYWGLMCPKNPDYVEIKSEAEGGALLTAYAKSCCGVLGVSFTWQHVRDQIGPWKVQH